MRDNRIIVVEDEEIAGELLKKTLEEEGYAVSLFSDGVNAIQAFRESPFPVVITDLEMPIMSGGSLIEAIKEIDEEQVVIVVTSYSDSATIIEIMKKGVYDYIIKPVDGNLLLSTVKRALEAAELRRMKKAIENERILKLQSQLEWFKWNENIISRNYDRVDLSLFTNLHDSFNQGAGFGSLLTLISLISASAKKEKENYLIDAKLFELIKKNAQIAEKILNFFSELVIIMNRDFDFEKISVSDLYNIIKAQTDGMQKFAKIKNIKIMISEPKPGYKNIFMQIEPSHFSKAFNEILINAIKFSKNDSIVMVMLQVHSGAAEISVVNSPKLSREDVVGIPFEYENLIFEPFFRMEKAVHEEFETPDYGLGLTLVEKVIKKHGGKISITNITDSSVLTRSPEVKVCASVVLPLGAVEKKERQQKSSAVIFE